jgi:hypothetical protein
MEPHQARKIGLTRRQRHSLGNGKRKQEEKKTESRKGENEVDEHNVHFFG